jgi:hypothetical protein
MIDKNFIHLVHPLILPAKDRATAYNFVLDKFKSKLGTYKADKLSHAARLELIKSVFASIPVYYMSNILFSKKFIAKLTAIIRNFWWTGAREETKSKSLCLRAWKDICTPKNEGGLGIRNLQAMNQALILMAAWRIADQPNEFLHSVLKSKYFPDSSLWRPNSNAPKSAFWASIIKMLPVLKAHSFYQITQGNISVWSTPWFTDWAHIYDALIIQPAGFSYPAQVKDLWLPNRQVWNTQLIDTLFQIPMAIAIKNTPIISSQDEDILCWKLTPTGKCNTKSAYRACLKNMQDNGEPKPREVNAATIQLLKIIWQNKQVTPRVQAFGWRLLRKAIPTGARAGKYTRHISKLCSRCGMEENDFHLFFTCNFARDAWFGHPWYIKTDALILNTNSLSDLFLKLLNMNHPNATLANVLTFMWCLWKSRNDNLFNKKKGHPTQIHQMANAIKHNLEMVDVLQAKTEKKPVQEEEPSIQGQTGGQLHAQHQIPPQGHTLKSDLLISGSKFFSDADWKMKKAPGMTSVTTTGIGVYGQIQDKTFAATVMIQASIPTTSSVLQAEANALLFAARIASIFNLQQQAFLTDNKVLAAAASSKSTKF